ncbi:sperm flagellar protein 2-like isoform X2 [Antedon mediterranea]|uniref:sperm flagellar protein 2-like isoform X2 n=1 Tax=Antedon mediterranea TaxID=105859 RepID=UPI003AF6E299
MTDILCKWLNGLKLSQAIDKHSFGHQFATGYMIGEVLQCYELQNDFNLFSQSKTADSKLNNFTRLEPTLKLLGIAFNTNIAHSIMTEEHGCATRLLYQLYIALNNKKEAKLTGVAMETMRPRAPVKLEAMERVPYKERLTLLTPRQTDTNLNQLVDRFRERKKQHLDIEFRTKFEEEENLRKWQQEQRMRELQKAADARQKQTELVARIRAAKVETLKPPANKTLKALTMRKEMKRTQEAAQTMQEISAFEQRLSHMLPTTEQEDDRDNDEEVAMYLKTTETQVTKVDYTMAFTQGQSSNDEYINKIRNRLQEDSVARKEREKRRRKILVDQLKAHEAQESARREEMLVNRLMRQSQQEKRIAVQLMQLRHEKAIICQNRILREKQYEERRIKDFEDALNKEAELARLAKLEYVDKTKKDKELHEKIMKERAEAKYHKHYNICMQILLGIVDFSSNIAEYRELTEKLLPPKLMREWKTLFVEGKPLHKPAKVTEGDEVEESSEDQKIEEDRQLLLDEGDFMEYKSMVGEWQPPEDSEVVTPQPNAVLGHILARLFNIVHPPTPPPEVPEMPSFPVKACFLGKNFAGKSVAAKRMSEKHGLEVLDIEQLVIEAVDAYKAGEINEEQDIAGIDSKALTDKLPDSLLTEVNILPPTPKTGSTAENLDSNIKAEEIKDEGKEKGDEEKKDEEKDVDGKISTESLDSQNSKSPSGRKSKLNLTTRAKLGQKANKFLRKGLPVKDELIVEIMVEAIKRLPEAQGWIMDGFPATVAQAKLLEKALTGYDANAKPVKAKSKQSRLAPDPNPPKDPPPPISGIDIVLYFDVVDEVALKRAAGRTIASQSEEEYQQEFKPPPEGSATGVGKQEKVVPVKDAAHDQEQIQHRLTGFQDNWKKLDKWFNSFGLLQKVDAGLEREATFDIVENIMIGTKEKIQAVKDELEKAVEDADKTALEPVDQSSTLPTSTDGQDSAAAQPSELTADILSDDKNSVGLVSPKVVSRPASGKRPGSGKSKRGRSPKGSRGASRGASPKRSPSSSKSVSPKRGKSGRKSPKRKTPTPEPEPEPEVPVVPTGPPPPQPGSEDWIWVDEPIEQELAGALVPYWENTEATYISSSMHVFRCVRLERETIYRYFYKIRRTFEEYLRRPDSKQEFIANWQIEYNEIAEDVRDDEETKSELHQRIEDLRERLWSISDNRKLDAEQERTSVMDEGWLEDRLGLLTNHYLTQMQAEVDRYQQTLHMLKDYYQGMEGKTPEEPKEDFIRIPLIDLPPMERPGSANAEESVTVSPQPSTPGPGKLPLSAKGKKSKDPLDEGKMDEGDLPEEKPKIPLVARRPTSSEGFFPNQTSAGGKMDKGKIKVGAKKEKDKSVAPMSMEDTQESPLPPTDPDERLIFEALQFGLFKISEMSTGFSTALLTAAELAAKEVEEELEKQKEPEKSKDAGGKKKVEKKSSKSKSPSAARGKSPRARSKSPKGKKSPKKGKKVATPTPPPTPPPTEDTPEEKAKKKLRERMKEEYISAINHEEHGLRARMELIKVHAIAVLQDLKSKADSAYNDMNDWLGVRFLTEMKSIDSMCDLYHRAIEKREKIQQELILFQDDFLVNKEVKVFRTPSPPPRPSPREYDLPDQYTVEEIRMLLAQFLKSAPSGFLSSKAFIDTLSDLTALTHGMSALPDYWMALTPVQLEQLSSTLSSDSEYIDWRRFLLQTTQPWTQPTQAQLLETLSKYKSIDSEGTGKISRQQFEKVGLWFLSEGVTSTLPIDPNEPLPYDRLANILPLVYDIFCDCSNPPMLDYVNMLLYFSVSPDYQNGFFRALSVTANTHMPRPKSDEILPLQLDPVNPPTVKEIAKLMSEAHSTVYVGPPEEDIPQSATNATVPLDALVQVLHHGQPLLGDSHRFSVTSDPEDTFSRERLAGVYQELGSENLEPICFYTLMEHPIIQDCLSMCHRFKTPDIRNVLLSNNPVLQLNDTDTQSMMS